MRVGFSIDVSDSNIASSALLEEVVASFGFNPRLDVPLCLEYYDFFTLEEAHTSLCKGMYQDLVNNYPSIEGDEEESIIIKELCEVIKQMCINNQLDITLLKGIDIIIGSEFERIVIWFNQIDLGWTNVN